MSKKQVKSNSERRRFWQMAIEIWQKNGVYISQNILYEV